MFSHRLDDFITDRRGCEADGEKINDTVTFYSLSCPHYRYRSVMKSDSSAY